MSRPDTKQFEKDYLRRTSAGTWETHKPFSPPGTNTLADSSPLIQDFAMAITHLPPEPADLILDLGAGACWNSDWLQRLNFTTVAVDISHDMLALGRQRLPNPDAARLVTGDLENLPFAAASFDKAYCLSAIHHVPNIPASLREIARVLKDDGAVFFSEPGLGHADTPAAVAAMQDFGVLEQDIVAAEFLGWCRDAGFQDVQLKPISYVIPRIGLSADEWIAWQRLARTKRPVRGLQRMWQGVLEVFGLGKKSVLLEETLAISLVRLLEGAMRDHPVIVARKSVNGHRDTDTHLARIVMRNVAATVAPGTGVSMSVQITNTGLSTWRTDEGGGAGFVRLGIQLLDAEKRLVDRDFHRVSIGPPLAPGESRDLTFVCPPLMEAGRFHVKGDMVIEGVTWLEPRGSRTVLAEVMVVGEKK
jgi:ubiquinone/menaquinone biosynthesis C-methylase UbiE